MHSGGGSAGDRFALAVTRQAVAQTALAVGCKYSYSSVLDALTDLVREYITTIGLEAQAKAEAGGRSVASILDVLAALEERQQDGRDRYELDWRSLKTFAFGDEVIPQVDRPDTFHWYQPFHTHIPPFPTPSKRPKLLLGPPLAPLPPPSPPAPPATAEGGGAAAPIAPPQASRPAYVPSFLPPFPAEHTFRKTCLKAATRIEDPAAIQQHRIATKQLIYKAIEKATMKKEEKGNSSRIVSTKAAAAAPVSNGTNGGEPAAEQEEEEYDDLFSLEAQPFGEIAGSSGSVVGGEEDLEGGREVGSGLLPVPPPAIGGGEMLEGADDEIELDLG